METLKKVNVEVKRDHLDKIASGYPIPSLAELIWNSLDADATNVDVYFSDGLIGIEDIIVKDNGGGIDFYRAEELFSSLGGSWKKKALYSNNKNR